MRQPTLGQLVWILLGLFPLGAWGQSLKQIAKFDLPGPPGKRFDYLTIDDDDRYSLSAHPGRIRRTS